MRQLEKVSDGNSESINLILSKLAKHENRINDMVLEDIKKEESDVESLGKEDSLNQVLSLLSNTTSVIKKELIKANKEDSEKCDVINNMFGVIENQIQNLGNSDIESVDSEMLSQTILANAHSLMDTDKTISTRKTFNSPDD